MRNLGRRDPGPYPLLPKCSECGHRIPSPITAHLHQSHWPWCSQAPLNLREAWSRREETRAKRTIGRIGGST